MRAGRLRCKVCFLKASEQRDDTGQALDGWTKFAETRGDLRDLQGSEYQSEASTEGQMLAVLWVRFRTDVTASHRCEVDGVTYEIQGPPTNFQNRSRWLKIRLRYVA